MMSRTDAARAALGRVGGWRSWRLHAALIAFAMTLVSPQRLGARRDAARDHGGHGARHLVCPQPTPTRTSRRGP